MSRKRECRGYTLSEVMIALALSVLVIGGVVGSLAHVLHAWRAAQVNSELNMNLELAMERMRMDMRLSSVGVGLMSFYPSNQRRYTAISFPMADDETGDGLLDRDDQGRILWQDTVIYHVLDSTPNEMRRTVFSPRKQDATPEALYAQLAGVAVAQSDAAIAAQAMDGEAANSRVIFRNLTQLFFDPPDAIYDTYAPQRQRAATYNFGSLVLNPGYNVLQFQVIDKNPASSGYRLELDRFRITRSGSAVEAEIFLPFAAHPHWPYFVYGTHNGTVQAEDMSAHGGAWSGNAQLVFNAAGVGSLIAFYVQNDQWIDSTFSAPGGVISSNLSVRWDAGFAATAPYIGEQVVGMDRGIAWSASLAGDETTLTIDTPISVENYVYGGGGGGGMGLALNGRWARLHFQRMAGRWLFLANVSITDTVTGLSAPVTFGGQPVFALNPGGGSGTYMVASDWIPMWGIDRDRTYRVNFDTGVRPDSLDPDETWSEKRTGMAAWRNPDGVVLSRIDGVDSDLMVGLHTLEVGYPDEALYRSGVFDTRAEEPAYRVVKWSRVELTGGKVDVRVRSGNAPDCSDGVWTGWFTSNIGDNSLTGLARRRYVQYEARLRCGVGGNTTAHISAPSAVLQDVTITWTPPRGLVDLVVDFGTGPANGIVKATVNGLEFIRSMVVDLEIFKEGPRGMQTVRGVTEIRPLNTGK